MNAERVISKINIEMNAFNESGSREDKACAEGLRRARTYVQQEVLKRKILTHDQQVVLEWLKKKTDSYPDVGYLVGSLDYFAVTPVGQAWKRLSKAEQFQVLAAFAEWGSKGEER